MPHPRLVVKANGPILVTGPFELVDPVGNVHHIPEGKVTALCRCGASPSKPFCTGAHNGCGFKADGPAPAR